jgi:hypothetical protein
MKNHEEKPFLVRIKEEEPNIHLECKNHEKPRQTNTGKLRKR